MVDPVGSKGGGSEQWGLGSGNLPPQPPLAPDDPWVKAMALLFPNAPQDQLQEYAAQLKKNMFTALNNEISRDAKRAKETARKFKESIEGNG
jgi:hypothetical protein